MDEHTAIDVLQQVKCILDEHGIEFWLDIGTLLGAVRDGKFISYDHDIDLGTWRENTPKICQAFKRFHEEGFSTRFTRYAVTLKRGGSYLGITLYGREDGYARVLWGSYNARPWLWKFFSILFWSVLSSHYANVGFGMSSDFKDVCVLIMSRLSRVMPACVKKRIKRIEYAYGARFVWEVPVKYFDELSIMKFYGMKFNVPARSEEYLYYRYGNDWKVPKKDWVTERDDGAVFVASEYITKHNVQRK